jgi:hypothetical protein
VAICWVHSVNAQNPVVSKELHYLAALETKTMAKTDQKIVNPKHEIRSIIGHSEDLFYKLTWKILNDGERVAVPNSRSSASNKLAKRKSYH